MNFFRRLLSRDDAIDALIAKNRFKPCAGMGGVDVQKLNRLGERTWQQKLRGQRRYREADAGRVVRFK